MSAAALVGVLGCVPEESDISTAILADVNSLTFEAVDAEPQSFNVISQGVWTVETPEWVSTDVQTGASGQSTITVSVADNVVNGQMQLPRTDTLYIKGADRYAHYYVIIKQLGDTYLGATEGTVTDAIALETGKGFGLQESQVVAVATTGFVVTDGTSNIYIDAAATVQIGDKVTLKGLRAAYNGMPSLTSCENITVTGNATAQHTTEKDLSASLNAYKATSIEYLAIKGATLVANQIISTDGGKLVFHNAPESFNIASLNAHYVDLYGYYLANDEGANGPFIVLTNVVDKCENENVKLPVKWNANATTYAKWSGINVASGKAGVIEPVEGFGQISYNWGLEQRKTDNVVDDPESKLDVNASNPRVNGAWTGDYWEFMSYVPAKAGQVIKLEFECRISGSGLRYWRMQYKDGNEWKDCRRLKSVTKADGKTYEYTDDVKGGSGDADNAVYTHVVKYQNDTDAIIFRWTCMAPWRWANDTEALGNPSTASMRLDCGDVLGVQPSISVATEAELPNDNVANVEVTVDKSLTFEALPAAPKSFKVLSDNEVELTADAKWILFVGADEALVETLTIPANTETEVFVTCSENVASATREGNISVKSGATTETIKVTQVSPGVSLEPFVSFVGGNGTSVTFEAGTLNLGVQTNVEFQYASDAAWVTVSEAPATRALVDIKQLVLNYEANADENERTAHIRVYNTTENIETVYTLVQAGYVSGIFFQDDFAWVQPFVEADDPKKQGDSMLDNKQYTIGSSYNLAGFAEALASNGYEALLPESKAIYVVKGNYLKFSKTSNTNGIRLPAIDFKGESTVELTFDWGRNNGKDKPADPVELEVVIDGSGTINGQKKSEPLIHTAGDWEWQSESIFISGVDATTRISIRPTAFTGKVDATETLYRWFLDNVKVAKGNPMNAASCTLATFPFPNDTAFDGKGEGAGTMWNLTEGWILSADGKSKLSANPATDFSYKYEAKADSDAEGTKDHVRVCVKSMKVDGYWQFEIPITDAPAGKVNFSFNHSASGAGPNYFLVEVSTDGTNWTSVGAQTTTESWTTAAGDPTTSEVTWTYALNHDGKKAANVAYPVNVNVDIPAMPGNNTLYFRTKVSSIIAFSKAREVGAGYNRIWGPCEVTFRKN